MDQLNQLDKPAREYITRRLKHLAAQDIDAIRQLELAAIVGQAELAAALGIFSVRVSDDLVLHARDVCARRAEPSIDGNWQ